MITVRLIESNGYDAPRLLKLHASLAIISNVMNSPAFMDAIFDARFHFRRSFSRWIDKPYSNETVYAMLMRATEATGNTGSYTMELHLNLIDGSNGSVKGYGIPNSPEIYTYKARFDEMTTSEMANHIVHEWTHKLGFTHAEYPMPLGKRNMSVPYFTGNIVEILADTYFPLQKLNNYK
ncbi:hypothetical protein [Flavobacterium pallidum]|uniref:Uncharacterized protein n=1 Tax=Flavobacterium pallidum TaxID=2172098 RepID=A0A2S1SHK0_9FLAO|nr:hypothetical protein [Flavobacterium pallidum]AWI25888.1 hypothetical protein HYN49_08235 [Flavobacterium pallidum]